jgi:hypothetical protein
MTENRVVPLPANQILPLFESWWTAYAGDLDRDSHWYQGERDAAYAAYEAGYAAARVPAVPAHVLQERV